MSAPPQYQFITVLKFLLITFIKIYNSTKFFENKQTIKLFRSNKVHVKFIDGLKTKLEQRCRSIIPIKLKQIEACK